MFKLFKKKKANISVVKLFKRVNYSMALAFNVLDVIDACVSSVDSEIVHVSWNFGAKEWKQYRSFEKFVKQSKIETVHFYLILANDCHLSFSNGLLNCETITENMKDVIELTVDLSKVTFESSFYSNLFKTVTQAESFDYGYVFCIPEKERGCWGATVNYRQEDLITGQTFNIDMGYIRDVYSYNLLNEVQLSKLGHVVEETGKLTGIADNLKLWTLTEDEIRAVKNEISFPVVP